MHKDKGRVELGQNLGDLPPLSLNTPALTAPGEGHPEPGTGHSYKANVIAPAWTSEGQQGSWPWRRSRGLGQPWELVMVGTGQNMSLDIRVPMSLAVGADSTAETRGLRK